MVEEVEEASGPGTEAGDQTTTPRLLTQATNPRNHGGPASGRGLSVVLGRGTSLGRGDGKVVGVREIGWGVGGTGGMGDTGGVVGPGRLAGMGKGTRVRGGEGETRGRGMRVRGSDRRRGGEDRVALELEA